VTTGTTDELFRRERDYRREAGVSTPA